VLEHARADQATIREIEFALAARKFLAGEGVADVPGETEFAVVAGVAQMPVLTGNLVLLCTLPAAIEQSMNINKEDDRVARLFLDLNSYFAACEQQENPALPQSHRSTELSQQTRPKTGR
jgi:hypothetical protein